MLSGACHTSEGRLGNRGEVRRVVLMGCTIGVFDMNSGRLDAEAREGVRMLSMVPATACGCIKPRPRCSYQELALVQREPRRAATDASPKTHKK